MSAESPRHARSGGPLTVPSQPPSDRSIIDAVSGFINDVTLSSSSTVDPKDVIQWARFETADINEPTREGDSDTDISPLLLILGYGAGVQVWLIPPTGEAQEVLSWRQGTVRVLRILPTPLQGDCFASKRPLIALCDSASPGPTFCSLSFISIRGGEQVKSIKFKNPILDVLANKRSIVVAFSERFAVFDAATLEDRLSVTTCYPCPCPLGGSLPINPLALGDRWVAYADKKLNPSKRSSGGCEGEGVTSYTATVLHAAKSLSKGLRGLGESVAHSLAGGRSTSQSPSPPNADIQQPGVVTILDIESNDDEGNGKDIEEPYDPIVAHFVAHSEAIIALKFDASGMLLVTADRRGHDFHVFRINPHPCGPSLASVHHLYVLHRGDTTAKVQDIAISCDSRWAAVSTLRGTTHVFAISPYGGACGVRTHTQPRVVNRLSRFHRSAGLPIHPPTAPRSGSPVGEAVSAGAWFPNPRLPPYPQPVAAAPLAQLRPTANLPTHTITRTSSGRQRLSSLSEECNAAPLLARARFGLAAPSAPARAPAYAALYLMAANGYLLHLVLRPRPARNVPKEKICDESPIELDVEAVAQWPLQRAPAAADLLAPLPPSNPLLQPLTCRACADACMSEEERWLSQVEIVTHAGPHRRLWMGPQFVFKTYNCTGSSSSLSEAETVEIDTSAARGVARSNPVNMPGARPIVPVLVDSGSASSLEHSPSDSFRRKSLLADSGRTASVCDVQLREDLAEAMKEDHGWSESAEAVRTEPQRVAGEARVVRVVGPLGTVVVPSPAPAPASNPLDADFYTHSNADESTFRPVVRAPAALPTRPDMLVRPLPRDTTIPVQSLPDRTALAALAPPDLASRPLHTDIVIPAALTRADRDDPAEVMRATHVHHDECNTSTDLERREKYECVRERRSTESAERARDDHITLPETSPPPVDIRPAGVRIKKSPTPKLVSDKRISDVSFKAKIKPLRKYSIESEKIETEENFKTKAFDQASEVETVAKGKECKKNKESTTSEKTKEMERSVEINDVEIEKPKLTSEDSKRRPQRLTIFNRGPTNHDGDESSLGMTFRVPTKKSSVSKSDSRDDDEIKTEEQAWDVLINEPEKPAMSVGENVASDKTVEDCKPKTKRYRKVKKSRDDIQLKAVEDNFIEIHAIDDKHQPSSGELVSISTAHEDSSTFGFRTRKSSSPRTSTPERKDPNERKSIDLLFQMETELFSVKSSSPKKSDTSSDIEVLPDPSPELKSKKICKQNIEVNLHVEHESAPLLGKDSAKGKKSKSLSPYLESKVKSIDIEKDVYVIDTSTEDFPEIEIRRFPRRFRGKSQEKESVIEKPLTDKPVKSWSSIAASKKKTEECEKKVEAEEKIVGSEATAEVEDASICEQNQKSSEALSLQKKLSELYKRNDIMIAECGEPSELHFVEEHHAVVHDLPPLEFGLDDFKLEDMRSSLLESIDTVNDSSPVCNINTNLDEILSTMEIEQSPERRMHNLKELEKALTSKVKGYDVSENNKTTTEEVKCDDVKLEKEIELLEKSSDDDITSPVLSTDSDKEDKKYTGASNVVPSSSKQSAKPKRSRRRKK